MFKISNCNKLPEGRPKIAWEDMATCNQSVETLLDGLNLIPNKYLVGGFNVGGIPTPLKNMSQLGLFFPIYGKMKKTCSKPPIRYG